MNKLSYKTSRDCDRLVELMRAEEKVICGSSFGSVGYAKRYIQYNSEIIQVCLNGVIHFHTTEYSDFIKQCEKYEIEFLDPYSDADSINKEMLEVLKSLEWCMHDGIFCPECARDKGDGHDEYCKLGNIIKKAEGK